MKARLLVMGLVLGVGTVLVLLMVQPQLINSSTSQVKKNSLEFSGLPTRYCATSAELVTLENNKVFSNQTIAVDNCRTVDLQVLRAASKSGTATFLVKLPNALAVRISLAPDVTALSVPIQLGDITNDNSIDQSDEDLVVRQIFNSNISATGHNLDIDNDGRVTSLDLAFTRLNRGVGAQRPDHQAWKVLAK